MPVPFIKPGKEAYHLSLICKPPDTSALTFAEEMADFMEYSINIPGKLITLGDINIHISDTNHRDATLVNDTFGRFNFRNNI